MDEKAIIEAMAKMAEVEEIRPDAVLWKQRPVCPYCDEKMVRAKLQLEDGTWIIVWLCSCINDV